MRGPRWWVLSSSSRASNSQRPAWRAASSGAGAESGSKMVVSSRYRSDQSGVGVTSKSYYRRRARRRGSEAEPLAVAITGAAADGVRRQRARG